MKAGDEIQVVRDRYGYKIGPVGKKGQLFRRVTTFTGALPKGWLGPWAANTAAVFTLQNWQKLSAMLGDIDPDDILSAAESIAAKEDIKVNGSSAIIQSVYDLVRKAPWEKRDAAGDRGTAVHAAIESFIDGQPLPDILTTEDELNCAIAAEQYLRSREHYDIKYTELTILNETHGYAGTLDTFGEENGETFIEDWKTSASVYVEHAVQQMAYQKGQWAIVDKEPIKMKGKTEGWVGRLIKWKGADRLRIVHVTPEKAEPMEIRKDVWPMLWDAFKCAKWMYQFQRDTDDYYSAAKVPVYESPLMIA